MPLADPTAIQTLWSVGVWETCQVPDVPLHIAPIIDGREVTLMEDVEDPASLMVVPKCDAVRIQMTIGSVAVQLKSILQIASQVDIRDVVILFAALPHPDDIATFTKACREIRFLAMRLDIHVHFELSDLWLARSMVDLINSPMFHVVISSDSPESWEQLDVISHRAAYARLRFLPVRRHAMQAPTDVSGAHGVHAGAPDVATRAPESRPLSQLAAVAKEHLHSRGFEGSLVLAE